MNLRFKGKINVSGLAAAFGGEGHFDSAGCFIPNKQSAMAAVLKRAKQLVQSTGWWDSAIISL